VSSQSQKFLQAAFKGDWDTALFYLNGLNMSEMLRSLEALGPERLIDIQWTLLQYIGRYDIPRLEYAVKVVIELRLPPAPGDLRETGQEQMAREYLHDRLSRASTQGCYCVCINKWGHRTPWGRVKSPEECEEKCKKLNGIGHGNSVCS